MTNCNCEEQGDRSMCNRNPRHEVFDRVVAKWETIRHYDVRSYDFIKPIHTEGLERNERFESLLGRNEFDEECAPRRNCCPRKHCHCNDNDEVGITIV